LTSIAYFITGHGFGHAARASAVISAVHEKNTSIHFELFTSIPQWFFDAQDLALLKYHYLKSDIGVVQKSALVEDPQSTVEELNTYYPIDASRFQWVEEYLAKNNVSMVICDISALGIFLSGRVQIPSVLIENFTWDWIYEGYLEQYPDFELVITYLKQLYLKASWHIQATPCCQDFPKIDLIANPISRKQCHSCADIRNQLMVESDVPLVLVTMGGVETSINFMLELKKLTKVKFVIPGASRQFTIEDNLFLIPHHSKFYHPDLVSSSDLVIGKLGYSTLAEIYYAGIPMMYFTRPGFRESQCLDCYVRSKILSLEITEEKLRSGEWKSGLMSLLESEKQVRTAVNGRYQVADFILHKLNIGNG